MLGNYDNNNRKKCYIYVLHVRTCNVFLMLDYKRNSSCSNVVTLGIVHEQRSFVCFR